MTTMTPADKLIDAADATDAVQDLIGEALEHLERAATGRINGYGVYRDPAAVRFALRSAGKKITAALQHMEATAWPTSDDYEAAE